MKKQLMRGVMNEYSHEYPINRTMHFRPAILIVNVVRRYYNAHNGQIDIWVGHFLDRGGELSPLSIMRECSRCGGKGGRIEIKVSGDLPNAQLKEIADTIGNSF